MRPERALVWYRRMSVVYGLGAWTLLGSLFLWSQKKNKLPVENMSSELSEAPKGFYVETVVTYKEDFVPITSRIVNYLKSWTGGPGPKS
uniref:Small integral membrane protein 26 n=1 Tax=Sus scrofa TaxID=9823 RepID=A0A8D0YWU6_PIG